MPALSFSFAKKAEPKRVVKELARQNEKEEKREAIVSLEEGKVTIDGVVEDAKKFTIPCKNPLQDPTASKVELTPEAQEQLKALREQQKQRLLDGEEGGLIGKNSTKLSNEDAEAARQLLKEASLNSEGGDTPVQAAPILMRDGSKKARDGSDAPEATRDMFDKVPIEGFGEALLRGMGFNPEKHKTKPVYHDKPRDNLLGLGAQALLPSEKAMLAAKRKGGAAAAKAKAAAAKDPEAQKANAVAKVEGGGATPSGATSAAPAEQAEKRRRLDGNDAGATSADEVWASRGLVVRIVGSGEELKKFFGAEGVVLEVDEAGGRCKVKARAEGKSHVLLAVALHDLETRVSRDCKEVRVVRGPEKGKVLQLVTRDAKRKVALVRSQGVESEMKLDDVCQFMV